MNQFSMFDQFPAPKDKTGWPWTWDKSGSAAVDSALAWPKISIVTPSYNQGAFLEETIRSVLGQGYPNLEYIIMDGGSKDETVSILKKYEKALSFWVSEHDEGQSDALNKGFARATGDIMAWLCADDRYFPGALRAVGEEFRGHPECQFLYGNGSKIDVAGRLMFKIQSDPVTSDNLCNWCSIFTPGTFWRRSLWLEAGGRVEMNNHFTMDWELMLRLNRCATPVKIEAFITEVRNHPDSKTVMGGVKGSQSNAKKEREIVRVSRQYGGLFCFNSVAYPFLRLAHLHRHLPLRPGWLYRFGFVLLHLPLKLVHHFYGRPKSNLMN